MATPPRQARGGGKAQGRDDEHLSDPLRDRDSARRNGGLLQHAQRWPIMSGPAWLRLFAAMVVLAVMALVLTAARAADGFVPVPPYTARVTDQVGMLTSQQRAALEGTLADYERKTGSQIAVLLVASTAPEAIEQYGIRVADAWKVGRKGVDDGVLLLVARDNPSSLRRLRIESGRGVQGSLTDAQSKRILQDVIAPRFRQQDFYGGLSAGVNAIAALMDKEFGRAAPAAAPQAGTGGGVEGMAAAAGAAGIPGADGATNAAATSTGAGPDAGAAPGGNDGGWSSGWLLPLLLFGAFVILPMMRGGSRRRGIRRGGWGSDATGVLLGAALGHALSNSSRGWGGGGGGFGGGSDFGGGGGGSFDGGGASGDW